MWKLSKTPTDVHELARVSSRKNAEAPQQGTSAQGVTHEDKLEKRNTTWIVSALVVGGWLAGWLAEWNMEVKTT